MRRAFIEFFKTLVDKTRVKGTGDCLCDVTKGVVGGCCGGEEGCC